jgi:adenylate cyclase class IV
MAKTSTTTATVPFQHDHNATEYSHFEQWLLCVVCGNNLAPENFKLCCEEANRASFRIACIRCRTIWGTHCPNHNRKHHNVEVKVRVEDLEKVEKLANDLIYSGNQTNFVYLRQVDTFYKCCEDDQGIPKRVKLREQIINPGKRGSRSAELITYWRPTAAVRTSRVEIIDIELKDLETIKDGLENSRGPPLCIVKKYRRVMLLPSTYLLLRKDRTRLHMDNVEGLGTFVELEVMMQPDEKDEDGEKEITKLLKLLELSECERIPGAYADLIMAKTNH